MYTRTLDYRVVVSLAYTGCCRLLCTVTFPCCLLTHSYILTYIYLVYIIYVPCIHIRHDALAYRRSWLAWFLGSFLPQRGRVEQILDVGIQVRPYPESILPSATATAGGGVLCVTIRLRQQRRGIASNLDSTFGFFLRHKQRGAGIPILIL